MTLPDFIGIGAQKAGTTWLGRNLQAHPQIWMPRGKEVHYFDERADGGVSLRQRLFGKRLVDRRWRTQVERRLRGHRDRLLRNRRGFSLEDLLWDLRYYARPPGDEWYASLFTPGEGQIAGEITPAYSILDGAMISRVHGLVPDARIFFFMRNPIERAWSQTVMHFDKVKTRDVKTVANRRLRAHLDREDLRRRTDYARTLDNWRGFYPEEQIFVGFLEDVFFFPEELLGRVYEFLGVDATFRPPNVGQKVHSRSSGTIPAKLATTLAHAYRADLERLQERFGGYTSFWLYCAERLIEWSSSEEPIPYPLWTSPMWREWAGSPEEQAGGNTDPIRLQSGPLSAIQAGVP